MKRWMEQTYKYHFNRIPFNDLSVDWTSHLSDYSVVIELEIYYKRSLPKLSEFILKEGKSK